MSKVDIYLTLLIPVMIFIFIQFPFPKRKFIEVNTGEIIIDKYNELLCDYGQLSQTVQWTQVPIYNKNGTIFKCKVLK